MSGLFSAMTRGAVIAFPMRRKAAHPMAAADFAGLPLLEAMVRVGTLAGKKVDAAGLTAALPTNDGDLDARALRVERAGTGGDGVSKRHGGRPTFPR